MYNLRPTSRRPSPVDALRGALLDPTGCHASALQIIDISLLEQYHTIAIPSVASHDSFEFDFDFNYDAPEVVRESVDYA